MSVKIGFKRLFLCLIFCLTCLTTPQTFAQSLTAVRTMSVAGTPSMRSSDIDLTQSSGVNLHKITWFTTGTVSAGACGLVAGSDGVTYGTTLISSQTVTSSGGPTTLVSGVYNHLRISCLTADGFTTLTGTGSVRIVYEGYIDGITGSQASAASIPVTLPTDRGGTVSILYDTNTNGKTTLIAGVANQIIYVRGVSVVQDTNSTVTVSLGSGTGVNCGTTYTAKTPAYVLTGPATAALQGFVLPMALSGFWFKTVAGENLCIQTNAGVTVHVIGAADQY